MVDDSFIVYHYLVVYAKSYGSMTPQLLTLIQHLVVLSHVGYIVLALQLLAHIIIFKSQAYLWGLDKILKEDDVDVVLNFLIAKNL